MDSLITLHCLLIGSPGHLTPEKYRALGCQAGFEAFLPVLFAVVSAPQLPSLVDFRERLRWDTEVESGCLLLLYGILGL